MVVGPLIGAGVGLASAIMQGNAQADSTNLQYLNLFEQKRQAMEREKLAKSSRTDAYGNAVVYVPGQGFVTKTTPLTAAILNAQQKEQKAQFTEDAPRARDAAVRIDKRSKQAGEVYDEKFNKYRYGRKRSKEEYVAEAIRDAIDARRGSKTDSTAMNAVSNMALRTGNSGAIPSLIKAIKAAGNDGTPTLAEAIALAKKQGRQQFFAEKGAEDNATFGELNQLKATADAFVSPNLNFNNENAALSGRQDNALSNLIATNAQSAQMVGSAYNQTANAAGKSVDLGGISQSLSGMKFGGKSQSPQEKLLADLLVRQRIGSAQIGINSNNAQLYKGNSANF